MKSNQTKKTSQSMLNSLEFVLSKEEVEKEAPGQEQPSDSTTKPTQTDKTLNSTNSTESSTAQKNATQVQNLIFKEEIKFDLVELDLVPLDKKSLDESRTKLSLIKEKEKEKRKKASAINSLEAFIFDTRDKLTQEEFIKCSNKDERGKISAKIDEVDAWLSEADDSVTTKEYTEKLTELKAVCKGVFFRISEKRLRPKRLEEMKEVLNKSVEFLANTKNLTGEDKPLTVTEWNTLDKLIISTKEWRVKLLNEQAKLSDNEQPKLLSHDISDKMEELRREVNYLASKIKYFRPKTTKKPPTEEKTKSKENKTDEEPKPSEGQDEKEKEPVNEDIFEKNGENENGQDQDQNQKQTTSADETDTTNNPEL